MVKAGNVNAPKLSALSFDQVQLCSVPQAALARYFPCPPDSGYHLLTQVRVAAVSPSESLPSGRRALSIRCGQYTRRGSRSVPHFLYRRMSRQQILAGTDAEQDRKSRDICPRTTA